MSFKNAQSKPGTLEWYDIIVITLILFARAIYRSFGIMWGFIQSSDTGAATADFNYWPNLTYQSVFLILTFAYLFWRKFDFSQLKLKPKWTLILWTPIVFAALGLLCDVVNTLLGRYNWFAPEIFAHIDWTFIGILQKFTVLPLVMVVYSLLNGFYEEFFFLGLMPTMEKKWGLPLMLLYSTLIRISFHTYQGWTPALITGIGVGLLFYVLYRFGVKNLWPFFLAHAMWDMFGGSLMYFITVWT